MSPLEAGTQAPDFSLSDQDGNQVRLADLRGKKVLIYFYPKAMTPGCTTQACGLRDVNSELTALNVVVLGISPDSAKRLKSSRSATTSTSACWPMRITRWPMPLASGARRSSWARSMTAFIA